MNQGGSRSHRTTLPPVVVPRPASFLHRASSLSTGSSPLAQEGLDKIQALDLGRVQGGEDEVGTGDPESGIAEGEDLVLSAITEEPLGLPDGRAPAGIQASPLMPHGSDHRHERRACRLHSSGMRGNPPPAAQCRVWRDSGSEASLHDMRALHSVMLDFRRQPH